VYRRLHSWSDLCLKSCFGHLGCQHMGVLLSGQWECLCMLHQSELPHRAALTAVRKGNNSAERAFHCHPIWHKHADLYARTICKKWTCGHYPSHVTLTFCTIGCQIVLNCSLSLVCLLTLTACLGLICEPYHEEFITFELLCS
jgi:hypothetical protein